MSHALTHIIIGLLIMAPFVFIGYAYTGAFVASAFYTGRELYQFYKLSKTHCDWSGCFDHIGWFPVVIGTFLTAYMIKILS